MDDVLIGGEPVRPLFCATCGAPLAGDPDDEPDGDAGEPICGECDRGRDFDALLESGEVDRGDGGR